ncbi:MAG: hypothetical protein KDI82_12225 [Gammaproteobacteria bacterium]|nr:hypothetical protein [Gammaproteobacteria bacterium]
MKKLIVIYFALSGAVAHLFVAGLILFSPGLVIKAQEKLSERLAPHAPLSLSRAAAAPSASWAQARVGLQRWQADSDTAGLADHTFRIDGDVVITLDEALRRAKDGSLLEIGPGRYSTPMVIRVNGLRVVGRGEVIFDGAVAEGKASLVIKGNDTRVSNIECRNVAVNDRNGACVRLEGQNLTLEHVYFHDAEQGMLTGSKPGEVTIRNSYFERLGRGGRAHAIYQGGGMLTIERSYILGAKDQAHEVKSRAQRTTIRNSVIASLTSDDSRLIDISNGGELAVYDSTLQQGPQSANTDMIGFALESPLHPTHRVTLQRNLIILERNGGNTLLHSKAAGLVPDISDNIIVAPAGSGFADSNLEYRDREDAKLPRYPLVPDRPV